MHMWCNNGKDQGDATVAQGLEAISGRLALATIVNKPGMQKLRVEGGRHRELSSRAKRWTPQERIGMPSD